MGDVIDFKTKEMRVDIDVDPQTRIEKGIVSLWQSLGGFDLELEEFDYLMVFMAFSDICFIELERENMSIYDDDKVIVQPSLHSKLKGIIDAIKTAPPANDE
jgi:hypothetical protein